MRQLLMNAGGVVVGRVPRPVVDRGSVLVRVHYSFVSVGTEIAPLRPAVAVAPDSSSIERAAEHAARLRRYFRASIRDPRKALDRVSQIAARQLRRMSPVPGSSPAGDAASVQGWSIGYSAAGEIVAVGEGVDDLAAGDLVACAGAGQANHADYIVVKRNLVCRVPSGVDLKRAASATIGAIAMQGVRRAGPQLGERACVLGLGLIGQITVQLLRAAGCDVVGLDLDAARVERARAIGMRYGAVAEDSLKAVVRDLTSGRGADQTLITAATKSNRLINLAMEVTRAKGRVVIVGDVGLKAERDEFYRKEIDLLMSTSYGPGRYDASYEIEGHDYPFGYVRWTENRNLQSYLDLLATGRVAIDQLIDRVVSIDDAPAVYRALADGDAALPLGVVIDYRADDGDSAAVRDEATSVVLRPAPRTATGRVGYALVGAGAFGTGVLVPQMDACGDRFTLKAVVTRNAAQGGNFARARRVDVITSSLDDVLSDPAIDLIVVATRHHEHAEQTVRALRSGKHVFVEKPLALTWGELARVAEAHESAPGRPLVTVGFNRRFSPAVELVKRELSNRRSPLVVEYRVNAGYLPLDHWVHGPQGGGRNIGEACHMYDVFRFLAGAPVRSIAATSIDPRTLPFGRNDNFSATIAYEDGTVATLIYTALGPKTGMGKEHITVFADGDALVVDDFRKVVRASDGAVLWQNAEMRKGHFEELARVGDAIAAGADAPIPFEQIVETSAVALQVEDLLFGRYSEPDE